MYCKGAATKYNTLGMRGWASKRLGTTALKRMQSSFDKVLVKIYNFRADSLSLEALKKNV